VNPPSAAAGRLDEPEVRGLPPQPAREVGVNRRRLDGLRQRPDLRLINGEGNGNRRTGSGRLRPVRDT
jgi:hypothetical protein